MKMKTHAHGMVADGFELLAETFEATLIARDHPAGSGLHVRIDGVVVADLWAGDADETREWGQDTPSVVFSCTKGLVSLLIGQLIKDGAIELDQPVSRYWPEFANGKERVTVRQLLSHRAGLFAVRDDLGPEDIFHWEGMAQRLAAEQPFHVPGESHLYHALTFGWLAGELVRRTSGMSVDRFFAEHVAAPLGASAWIGVPESELDRVATLYLSGDYFPEEEADVEWSDLERFSRRAMDLGHAVPREFVNPGAGFNDPQYRRAVLPGAGGVASARALATIWSSAVSDNEAIRLLDSEVIGDMRAEQSAGCPAVFYPGPWPRWGSGFMLNSEIRPFLSDSSFGHDGLGGQVAFADERHRVGFGYVTNDLQVIADERGKDLVYALRTILG